MEYLVIGLLAYLLLKDIVFTWKELELIDRSLPRSPEENKIKWFVAQMRDLLSKSKKVRKTKKKKVPKPEIVDTGEATPPEGPETPIHKQGVDTW